MIRTLLVLTFAWSALLVVASPMALAQKKSGLVGTIWNGRENLVGYGDLTFEFEESGNVTMVDAKETVPGRYARNGTNITLNFFNGQAIYSGRISGRTMSGTARNGQRNWTWKVTLESDPSEPDAPKVESDVKKEAPVDPELKAAQLLAQAKQSVMVGAVSLARVRFRIIVNEYGQTKAAKEAKQLLDKLEKSAK